jgi:hypothetical protein
MQAAVNEKYLGHWEHTPICVRGCMIWLALSESQGCPIIKNPRFGKSTFLPVYLPFPRRLANVVSSLCIAGWSQRA